MLTGLLKELGWFRYPNSEYVTHKEFGKFTISGGTITPLSCLQDGQYYRVVGSIFNDGMHRYPDCDMTDETFDGAIWAMRIPPEVLDFSDRVDKYNEEHPEPSPYTSESFGGFSYVAAAKSNGMPATWRDVFADELNKWRMI